MPDRPESFYDQASGRYRFTAPFEDLRPRREGHVLIQGEEWARAYGVAQALEIGAGRAGRIDVQVQSRPFLIEVR